MKWKILFILCCSFLLTGCWNYRELNELSIVTGMSIDKREEQYVVGLLISNAKKTQGESKEGESQTIVLNGKGHTILEAIKDVGLSSPKELYFQHLLVLVVSEDIAKEGVYPILDYLFRDSQSRKTFYFILAKDTEAIDTLKIVTPLESFPSQNIAVNINQTTKLQAIITDTTYNSFLRDLLMLGKHPSVNSVTVEGSVKKGEKEDNLKQTEPDAIIKMGTLGIFKKDRLLGWTTKDENRGISILQNQISIMYSTFDYKKIPITITLPSLHSKTKVIMEHKTPIIEVTITGTGIINEVNGKLDLEDPSVITALERSLKKELHGYIEQALEVTQKKYKSDIFGYGNMIYKKNPAYFKKIKDTWDEEGFPNLEIKIKMDVTLNNKGSLKQSIKEATRYE